MKRTLVVGASLIVVCLALTVNGPSAQRIITGDGGGGSSSAVPVSVANFPQVQAVQVDKTVNVTGSVAITNLPAVQQVAGTVSVGNLPVDAEGNIRVSSPTPGMPPRFRLVKIADRLNVTPGSDTTIGSYDISGWKRGTVFVRETPSQNVPDITVGVFATQALDGSAFDNFSVFTTYGNLAARSTQDLFTPELSVRIIGYQVNDVYATVDVWLYLTE